VQKQLARRNLFKAALNLKTFCDNCLRVSGRWLYNLILQYRTAFRNAAKFATAICKS
jgi:hypothetical protein